jgi:hypothetical protein
MILGIDIGGANTKIATVDGSVAEIHYLPLWKSSRLADTLCEIAERLKPEKLAVVMTGELADCFLDKKSGVESIKTAVEAAFSDSQVRYVNVRGELTDGADMISLAAANWCASVRFLADEFENCVFVDMGSTTTDVIPIVNASPVAHATDFQRLLNCELVYTGVLRTAVAALVHHVDIGHRRCAVAAEFFANMADVHLLLGHIREEDYTCETPDGAGRDVLSAKRRLARLLCADLSEVGDDVLYDVAEQVHRVQVQRVREALRRVAERYAIGEVVACGIGEFLVQEAAWSLGMGVTLLSERYGVRISKVFPAYAAARLMGKIYEEG